MDRIDDLSLFCAIVDSGGISAAARMLGSSPPAVSRRLAALEARLNARLVDRAARRFFITAEGRLFHRRCCAILDQLHEAEAEVAAHGATLVGRLRISMPCDLGRRRLAPAVGAFAKAHPGLDLHVIPSDAGLLPGRDDIDVALRIDQPRDRSLIIRKLGETRLTLCAAPDYLARYSPPTLPADLARHPCLRLARRDGLIDVWRLTAEGQTAIVKVGGVLSSASGEFLRDWAIAGLGIGLEAGWDIEEDLAEGRLMRVLPDWRAPKIELFAAYLPGKPVAQRIRAFVDAIAASLARSDRQASA